MTSSGPRIRKGSQRKYSYIKSQTPSRSSSQRCQAWPHDNCMEKEFSFTDTSLLLQARGMAMWQVCGVAYSRCQLHFGIQFSFDIPSDKEAILSQTLGDILWKEYLQLIFTSLTIILMPKFPHLIQQVNWPLHGGQTQWKEKKNFFNQAGLDSSIWFCNFQV